MVDVTFYSIVGFALRVRAELHGAAGAPAALRHRHGRRVGARRRAGDGEDADRAARASSPASCSRATRSATCWPRWLPGDRQLDALGLARAVRVRSCPALISLFLRSRLTESEVVGGDAADSSHPHGRSREAADPRSFAGFVYLVLLMTAFNWMSHGTQDIYPTFLKKGLDFSPNTALYIAILYNIGAMIGGTILGGAVRAAGPAADDHPRAVLGLPIVPLFALLPHARPGLPRLVPDAVLRAGRLGCHPGPPDRAVAPTRSAASTPASPISSATAWPRSTCRSRNALPRSHSYAFALTVTIIPVLSRSSCWPRSDGRPRASASARCRPTSWPPRPVVPEPELSPRRRVRREPGVVRRRALVARQVRGEARRCAIDTASRSRPVSTSASARNAATASSSSSTPAHVPR